MKCARCEEKDIEIIVTLSVNGKIKKIGLCIDCANIMGYYEGNIKKADITEYIKNLIEDSYPKKKQKIVCNFCKTSYVEFLRSKKFGCPFCYLYLEYFISEVTSEIKNEYNYRTSIESIIKNKKNENIERLYLKLKTYLDHGDTQMAEKIISKIKKYDNSQET